jgi:hypothetical protein
MFHKADLVLISKIDLLPHLPEISMDRSSTRCVSDARAALHRGVGADGRRDRRVGELLAARSETAVTPRTTPKPAADPCLSR